MNVSQQKLKNTKELLSIVIPVLNEEKNLNNLFNSLKKQTFQNFEVIVADAGSKDSTVKKAKDFGATVVKGGMPSVGRNAGAKVAQGEMLFFFDADVVLTPTFLEEVLRKFKERKLDAASCFSNPISKKKIDKLFYEISNYFTFATEKIFPHASGFCILVKKQIHEKAGGFDESLILAEDHEYIRRVAHAGKFEMITDPRIDVSVRRLDKDGRLNVAVKYLLVEAYVTFIGEVRSDIFRYKFNHYNQKEKKVAESRAIEKKFLSLAKKNFVVSKGELLKIYHEATRGFRTKS